MHGIRACLGQEGLRIDGPRIESSTVATDVLATDGSLCGSVYGPVTQSEANALVASVSTGADPAGPDVPWLVVARSGRVGLAAASSTMLPSGLFWSASGGHLVVASDPVAAANGLPKVDAGYVRAYAAGRVGPDSSPFSGVRRIVAGTTARWDTVDSAPQLTSWVGPQAWGPATLEGPGALATYLEVFDSVVSDLARRAGPLVTTVSGGLDSTFVAAALARESAASIRGLVYAPLAEAMLGPQADETALAMLMAQQYPGRLTVETIMNTDLTRPLHAAASAAKRAGVPTFNPANQPWLTAMRQVAAREGAGMWFVGSNGNAAFSYHHPYAVKPSLRARVRRRIRSSADAPSGPTDRQSYLAWLARSVTGLPAAGNPAAMEGVLMADPFAARAVMEVAAAITPSEWVRGDRPRAFARRAADGRVPDAIRLRSGRGQQGRDAWYVIRSDRDDYLARIAALPEIAGLEDIDHHALADQVASWPWGEVHGPPWLDQVAVDRVLGLAEFTTLW